MKHIAALVSCVLLFFTSDGFSLSFFDAAEPDDGRGFAGLAERIVREMSDEQALAQTFMLGWVGAEPSPLIVNWIRDRNIGGVKIFGWNTGDTGLLARAIGALQSLALETEFAVPLLVATDQEGGWVRHVKGATSETPGNMAIGASGYPMDAYWSGFYIGKELAVLGINMNFAPTVDLYTDRESTLIGPRSFGTNPVEAGILGAAFVRGLEASGIIATAKHYPGHGDTDLDSHGVLPRIDIPFETIWERELVPYRLLVREGLSAIMSGHLAFPRTLAGDTPASLSPWFLKTILRERMGFAGLVITDDLMMNGASMYAGSLSRAAKQALAAGNDIVMLSRTPNLFDPVWTSLVEAMAAEKEFRDSVRASAVRIVETKLNFFRAENHVPFVPDLKKVADELPDPEASAFFLDLAARSVTVIKNGGSAQILPLAAEDAGRVLLAGTYGDFFRAGEKAFPGCAYFELGSGNAAGLARQAANADTIIFCLAEAADLPYLKRLENSGKTVIVFSVLSPIHLEEAPWADAAIAVYSYAPESFVAGFSAILGRISAEGNVPFPLNLLPEGDAAQSGESPGGAD